MTLSWILGNLYFLNCAALILRTAYKTAGEMVITSSCEMWPIREMTTTILIGSLGCCLQKNILKYNVNNFALTNTFPFETLAVLDFDLGTQIVQVAGTCVCKVARHSGPFDNFANVGLKTCVNNFTYIIVKKTYLLQPNRYCSDFHTMTINAITSRTLVV